MKTRHFNTYAVGLAMLLTLIATASTRAGTISVVDLPATDTDAASDLSSASKYYVCAFNFGNSSTNPTINGVLFTHFNAGQDVTYTTTAKDLNYGGTVTLTAGPNANNLLGRTTSATQGSLSSQADGGTFALLNDLIYPTGSAPVGTWLQQDYGGLTAGHTYSLRIYYRYWGGTVGGRTLDVSFNGEGAWEAYAGNPLAEDAGGAHYLQYDFTAASTTVSCLATNLVANQGMHLYGATLEDSSYPFAPVIVSQTPTGPFSLFANQTARLSVTVNGGPQSLAYQWLTNGVADTTETSAVYLARAASSTAGETFQCIVTGDNGTAMSDVATLTAILPLPAAVTGSYSTNILALNPSFYWPMHEQTAPAPGDIETNHGTLGALGTGYYADWAMNDGAPGDSSIQHGIPGALANDPDGAVYMRHPVPNNSYLLVPHTSPLTTLNPPFTIELWVKSANYNFGDLVSQCGTELNVGNANNKYGLRFTWGSNIQTYGSMGQGITATTSLSLNEWHHVVLTCDSSTNWVLYGDSAVIGTHAPGSWRPDSWDPLTIGAGMWNSGGVTRSTDLNLDEVAIYTKALSETDIANHYAIATNPGSAPGDYYNAVISNSPLLYYRMNSPSLLAPPPTNTWPELNNYGTTAGNGVYMPGIAPGSAAKPAFCALAGGNALAGNGVSAFADAGFNPALNPTGFTPFTVTACFKGNPADSRFQNIVGHSDSSWRIALDPTGKVHFNAGAGGEITSAGVYNDGKWHQAVCAYDGTSNYLYVDGVMDSQREAGTNGITGSTADILLGADPQYLTGNTGAGRQFAGDVCEVAFFPNVLSAAEIQSLYETLGFAVTTISEPVLSRVDSSDVFSVTADGEAPAYQWYINTVSNYSGATAMTDSGGVSGSTTPSVTIADLSAFYFAVAANVYGAATSSIVQVPQLLEVLSAGKPIWNQTSQTNVIVTFSDMLDPSTATLTGNYSLDNGASISSVALVGSNEVVLTTSALDTNAYYTLTVQNVLNYWGVVQTPSPASLAVGLYPANLAIWIRADSGVTTDPGTNTVYQWSDLSGNGNHFYSGDPSVEPQLVTNAWGDPVIRFNATDTVTNYMVAYSSGSVGITGDMSIIAVINVRTRGGRTGHIVSKTGYPYRNIAAPYDYYVGGTAAALFRGNGNGTVNGVNYGQYTGTQGPSADYPYVVAVSETGNTVSHYLNGQAVGTGLLSKDYQEADDYDLGNPAYIGARADGYNRLAGDLAELIVAGSPISAYGVAELANYLSAQHHFVLFDRNPTNIAVSFSNNQGTLSWPADHTGWQLQSNSVGLEATGAWFPVSGSTLTNQITITPDASQTNVFYRLLFQQP